MNTKYLNKNFRFVFTPRIPFTPVFEDRLLNKSDKRFLIGGGTLTRYLTKVNAETVQKSCLKMKTDKVTLKFRKYGKIDIYAK